MNKSDLVERLCQDQKLPRARAELLVDTIFAAMEGALARNERIEIRGFGSFEIRQYEGYDGRNPRTGAIVSVKGKRLPFFKVGKELRDRINEVAARIAARKQGRLMPAAAPVKNAKDDGEDVQTIALAQAIE